MIVRFWLPTIGILVFSACSSGPSTLDGAVVLEEAITLERGALVDSATREITVDGDSTLVGSVEESLTDVRLKLSLIDPDKNSPAPVEVENNLRGSGLEVAALEVPHRSRIRVTLTGAPNATTPGRVKLKLQWFKTDASQFAGQLVAFKAWSAATNATYRADKIKEVALPEMNRAIASLEKVQAGDWLAAEARLLRAHMLQYFKLDFREARAEAQRAAAAFAKLPTPDTLNVARAHYLEALALYEMSDDSEATNPTSDEAKELTRGLLKALGAPESALGPIEKARALAALGALDLGQMLTDDSTRHFEQARTLYQAAGYTAGERDMRFSQPMVLVELGRFAEARIAYDPLLPELDKIQDPELRAQTYLAVTRAQSMDGRIDEAVPLLFKVLSETREHQLRMLEATVLESLGYIYSNRGDLQQAAGFFGQALKIMSEQKGGVEYAFALMAAAGAARKDGDLDRSYELASEAMRRSTIPIAKARAPVELGMYYRAKGDLPNAIATFRKGLAVDLGDPHHHAHTDGRLYLATCEIEYEPSTPADLVEAGKLLDEALATSVKVGDASRQIIAYRNLGYLNARLGKNAAALRNFDRALVLSQELRARSSSTEARATMLRDEQGAFRGYLDIAFANVTRRPPGTLAAASPSELAAVRRLEAARRASFGALRVGSLDAAASSHIDELLQQMGQKSLRIAALLNQKLDAGQAAELQSLQFDMSGLHAELDNLRWSEAAKNDSASSSASTPAWRVLAPGAAQLSYVLAEDHVYVLVRDATGTRLTVLVPTREALEAQLAELTKLDVRTSSAEIEKSLELVSDSLLPTGLLPKDSTTVEIVAEGRIASVPFPALRSPTDPHRRLVDTHDIAMVTSLFGVDAAPRQKAARPFRFVALASGHGTYRDAGQADPTPKLQVATREIKVAAGLFMTQDSTAKIKLLTGAEGNAAALRDIWSSGADVVHFATHALADLRQPIASLLVLPATDEGGRATYLTAGQVQGWRGDTELVFLSACESAIGPPQFAAGMPGLQRAFLRAGARGVIATLAPIEDVLAQEFSADFYKRYTSGESPSRALSETQRAWLVPNPRLSEADQLRRRITALSHAYFTG